MGMLTKTLKSCKDNMHISIYRDNANLFYWLSSGTVAVNLGGEFAASGTDIIKMLELPPEKADRLTSVVYDEPQDIPIPGGKPLERLAYGIAADGYVLQPFKTDKGTLFVQNRYLDVFKEFYKRDVEFFLENFRGKPVVCVSCDEELIGMIAPFSMEYNKICSFASKFMMLTFKARQNGFMAEPEQMSLIDPDTEDDEADNAEE